MHDTSFHIVGELSQWPDKNRMAAILPAAGLNVTLGQYSLHLDEFVWFGAQPPPLNGLNYIAGAP